MPRVHTVEKNRKEQECRKCGATITIGAGYRHWSFRYGGKVTRCMVCPRPRPSELTQSGYKQQAYGAQEGYDDSVTTLDRSDPEGFRDAVASLVDDVRQVAEDLVGEYEDALSEWEHGNSMIEERKEAAEAWQDELENSRFEVESMEPDLPDELDEEATDEEKEEYESDKESAIEDFCNSVDETASEAINNCDI